jgi:hypothetical protein
MSSLISPLQVRSSADVPIRSFSAGRWSSPLRDKYGVVLKISVMEPNCFFSDPDPALTLIRIRIRVVYEKYIWTAHRLNIVKKADFLKPVHFWTWIVDEKYIWTADNLNIAKKLTFFNLYIFYSFVFVS